MKIGIITQSLRTNYGGLLQNYALQKTLQKLGHETYTITRKKSLPWYKRIIKDLIILLRRYFKNKHIPLSYEYKKIARHCAAFVKSNITITKEFYSRTEFENIINRHKFDGYIVGSDQVWRPIYSANIYDDFLTFCQDKKDIKRLAYAASFGVDEWEFSEEETKECNRLAQLFDAISVREESGIKLCKEHLGVEATHVLDPTLLLEKEEYIKLAELNNEEKSEGELFCYILDATPQIENSIKHIEQKLSLHSFQVKAKKDLRTIGKKNNIKDYIIPSPIKWIRAFMETKMVFTDSFHGCVFSIIFNKPFWVIGNKERGNARFASLLKLFKLEDRIIDIEDIEKTNLSTPVDWEQVNTIKKEWQNKSLNFIKNNL